MSQCMFTKWWMRADADHPQLGTPRMAKLMKIITNSTKTTKLAFSSSACEEGLSRRLCRHVRAPCRLVAATLGRS